ncbi:hypothetical protein SSPS47_28260 [Streptomyces sp. S4.7]|uniref:hypothetical protein n=1 Tax=Streptomyces sp. S4.7 TaxID=2705439 RepID=UPI001398D75A|nr:hypothetical protein [Streptomyces sp. S4.7]QHY99002.1 hypothetical protein SSPS47_28260 [Streptomyces sp. S4.7]
MRIAEELLFALPPGRQSARIRHDNALVYGVTGQGFTWRPPEGLVPEGSEFAMKHPSTFRVTTPAAS